MNTPKSPLRRFFSRQLTRRHGGLLVFFGVFLTLSLLTRVVLLCKAASDVTWTLSLVASFAWGLLFDIGAASWAALPLLFLLTFLPSGWFKYRWQRWLAYAGMFTTIYLLLFGTVAEWVFWDEFGVRFNFIAVDYLVYTTEVIGNIRESYNLPFIFGGLLLASSLAYWLCWHTAWMRRWAEAAANESFRSRMATGAVWFAGMLTAGLALSENQLPSFRNNFNRELAKDGLWSLFAAFKNNEIDYDQFYRTRTPVESFKTLNKELIEDGSVMLRPGELDTLRFVSNPGPELKPNVIQITVESLSADFLSIFNRASNLTPNLAEIAGKSLTFDNFYATGTRTDRGMEALTLSMPPTPGRSIVKRPRNENLFTLGSVFRTRGYDTAFIYGGFGYFDNMNYFFGNNGYRVIDRTGVAKEDITFANVWGVCDEDLFRWTLREADASAASGKPFHYFVMTTSNHRPYTFPEGKIDLPSKVSGRAGAVKYTDYAIGKFLRDAESKPWFKNTVFVIVADHCAASAGKTELPVQNYHIPLFIYSPGGLIAPGHVKTLTSQMDYGPTLLGLLNWSYPSRFFGHDVRKIQPPEAHALLGNYQKLGHIENGDFVILKPQRGASVYRYDFTTGAMTAKPPDEHFIDEAISFYEAASYMYKNGLYKQLTMEEEKRYTEQGQKQPKVSQVVVNP